MPYFYLPLLSQSDGWDTEPFVMTEVNGKFYGRGSTDDKVGQMRRRKKVQI